MMDYLLNHYHLEEQFEKISEDNGSVFVFWESKKAMRGDQMETLELYLQHAIEKLRHIS